jgi:hypothetical protein
LRQEGILINDTRQKAEILNLQYHSVFTPECENEELPSLTENYPSMPEITVTANGTEKLLNKLDPYASKATGRVKFLYVFSNNMHMNLHLF